MAPVVPLRLVTFPGVAKRPWHRPQPRAASAARLQGAAARAPLLLLTRGDRPQVRSLIKIDVGTERLGSGRNVVAPDLAAFC